MSGQGACERWAVKIGRDGVGVVRGRRGECKRGDIGRLGGEWEQVRG